MARAGDYGLGAPQSWSVLEVAAMFGGPVTLLPPRRGNRMDAELDTSRAAALGWRASRRLPDYIAGLGGASPCGRQCHAGHVRIAAMKRIGLYPGTFDPVTLGHLDIIKRAVKLVDTLVIGVATNASKAPLFLAGRAFGDGQGRGRKAGRRPAAIRSCRSTPCW